VKFVDCLTLLPDKISYKSIIINGRKDSSFPIDKLPKTGVKIELYDGNDGYCIYYKNGFVSLELIDEKDVRSCYYYN